MDMVDALYVRVSTTDQTQRSQEPHLTRYEARADHPCVWYRDHASGLTMDRPGWNALWSDILSGRVARVVVWRLDRLGRTARGLSELFDELPRRKVGLVSLTEGLDLATSSGRLMAHVIASVAQYETEVRAERQRAGIDAARAAGVHCGRPVGTGRPLTVTDDRRALVVRLDTEGVPRVAIARQLGISRDSVYRVLRESGTGTDGRGVQSVKTPCGPVPVSSVHPDH